MKIQLKIVTAIAVASFSVGTAHAVYVANDPVNNVDPDGQQALGAPLVASQLGGKTTVTLKAYPIGNAPGVGTYGHGFVEYGASGSTDTRISRAGPSAPYPGGSSDAVANKGFDGVNVEAIDSPSTQSIDNGVAGTVNVQSIEVPLPETVVQATLESFNSTVNSSGIEYKPRGPNSNTYSGDAFEVSTGISPENNTDIKLLGIEKDLDLK